MKILQVEKSDVDFVWSQIQKRHLIYHEVLAPKGEYDIAEFQQKMRGVPGIILIDRNLFSALLKACEQGTLSDLDEFQNVGLLMFWARYHRIEIAPVYAVQEYATRTQNEDDAAIEFQKFTEIWEQYNPLIWLDMALKRVTSIPKYSYSGKKYPTTIKNADGCYHYYLALGAMLHLVRLLRNKKMKTVDKLVDFYSWMYANGIISTYIMIYSILVLKNYKGIKYPKGAFSNDFEKIVNGCENQAWDLSYVANWIRITHTTSYQKTVFFATNDTLLQDIFGYGLNIYTSTDSDWINSILSRKERESIMKVVIDNTRKPPVLDEAFIRNLKTVIEDEKQTLKNELN